MARKTVERGISYDDVRKAYYVYMDYGRDEDGQRVKKYKTCATLAAARRVLRDFQSELESRRQVTPRALTLDQWLEYWMEQVVEPLSLIHI